jgi:outer membrane protein assembly factor BamB
MSHSKRKPALVLTCIVAMVVGSAGAQDWPQWRGTNRDAKAAAFTVPASWPKALTQKWKLAVGEGVATPALVGDKLYVFARQNDNEVLRCLDAATSNEIWQDKYPAQGATGPASEFSGPRCSPAVAEGKVVTLGVRGMLSCLDAETGKKLWRKDDFQGAVPRFYASSSPIIVDGLCIAQLGGEGSGAIVAYDLTSGDQKWKWTGDGTANASPSLMIVGSAKLLIAETDHKIVAVSVADGKQLWETPFAAEGRGAYNAASPIVDGQILIYSGGGRGTRAVKIAKEGDGFIGKELWSNPEKSVQFASPVLKDGLVYGLSESNELFCLNAETGKSAWSTSVGSAGGRGGGGRPGGGGPGGPPGGPGGGRPGGPGGGPGGPGGRPGGGMGGRGGFGGRGGGMGRGGYGTIVDAGSVLMALTPGSELIVFQPGESKYTEQAKIKVADSPTYAYPVLSGNRVFVKDQDSVTLWTVE